MKNFTIGGFNIKITVLDRVILHLYHIRSFEGNSEMPEETTQRGIAQGININYSHVPRAVKNLLSSGFIIEITAHSSANPAGRRRKAYYLTDKGIMTADKMMNNLNDLQIVVEDESRNSVPMSLGQLKQYLKTDRDLFSLVQFISSENIFNIYNWERQIKNEIGEKTKSTFQFNQQLGKNLTLQYKKGLAKLFKKGIILDPSKLTIVSDFINRDTEIKVLRTELGDESSKLIFITGPMGIGKTTTLVRYLVDSFTDPDCGVNQESLLWFNTSRFDSCNDFLSSVLENFKSKVDSDNSTNLESQIRTFLHIILDEYKTIIIDDLDLLREDKKLEFELGNFIDQNDPMTILFKEFLEVFKEKEQYKIIVNTSQTEVVEYLINEYVDNTISQVIEIIKLNGLDLKSVKQFFGSDFLPEFSEAIFQLTDGNPNIIQTIKKMDKSIINDFQQLPAQEGAMALVLKAQNMLNIDQI
jgi:DNA-binding MarR family transcriptional regulator